MGSRTVACRTEAGATSATAGSQRPEPGGPDLRRRRGRHRRGAQRSPLGPGRGV